MGYRSKFTKTNVYQDIDDAFMHSPYQKGTRLRKECMKPEVNPLVVIQEVLEDKLLYNHEIAEFPNKPHSRAIILDNF